MKEKSTTPHVLSERADRAAVAALKARLGLTDGQVENLLASAANAE